jgi:DNA polymerase-3 subunit beta
MSFDVADLAHAINRAKLLTAGIQNGTVKLTVTAEKTVISVNTPEVGSSFEEINVLERAGDDLTISFNPQFLSDALKAIKEPVVRIRFISAVRPFTLIPKEEGTNFVQLITPVRTN